MPENCPSFDYKDLPLNKVIPSFNCGAFKEFLNNITRQQKPPVYDMS